jgi:hypothetical protein
MFDSRVDYLSEKANKNDIQEDQEENKVNRTGIQSILTVKL